jgi:hypothetical protein
VGWNSISNAKDSKCYGRKYEEVYPLLFPARNSVEEVYAKIISDLQTAVVDAPDVSTDNKFLLSKAVANALLARVYAEKPVRDYEKVIKYCNDVQSAVLSWLKITRFVCF